MVLVFFFKYRIGNNLGRSIEKATWQLFRNNRSLGNTILDRSNVFSLSPWLLGSSGLKLVPIGSKIQGAVIYLILLLCICL